MNRLALSRQAGALKSYFPKSKIILKQDKEITWIDTITPTPLSNSYKVKIQYRKGIGIKVYVIDPIPLSLAKGQKFLPHVYSTPKQQLCLYYPKNNEWNPSMYYVHTIIPWISEWLFHYEIWVSTGEWKGGGIHHEEVEKQIDSTNTFD